MSTDDLPALPEPNAWHCYWRGDNDSTSWDQWHDASDPLPDKWDSDAPDEVTPHFTAGQMHAYARAAVAQRDEQIAKLTAEVEALRAVRDAASDAAHAMEGARVWSGMQWHYNPLHPIHYKPALEKLRAAIDAARAERDTP